MKDLLTNPDFSPADIQAFEPALKIGILATINPAGLPHLTMISSLKAGSASTITWGQFIEGSSKTFVQQNPNTAFLIMNLEKQMWRGKARWTHSQKSGADYDWYNNIPMFRYNAYFGIHTVHYMDLLGHTGRQPLPMQSIILAAIQTLLASTLSIQPSTRPALNDWSKHLFNKMDNLKFLAWVGEDGFPWIVPVIQAQVKSSQYLYISTGAFGSELAMIPTGSPVAVLGLALTMEDVLARGTYLGIRAHAGLPCASVEVDWVYNPMPPVPGQIYPSQKITPVSHF
jgi:hypothetical protein